ncbi:MAG TPA: hypothetical protein VFC73_09245 [Syntrophomonadaceae bacterium]|nr:hypothetical protein [Syntrophomonadaceae bacterium]
MLGILISAGALVAFVMVIVQHEKLRKLKDLTFSLTSINKRAIDRINWEWVDFTDSGEEYIDQNHSYSVDLDIFGQASIFQWINNTFTFLGRKFFKNVLIEPEKDVLKIKERQGAINELAVKLDWRQHFLAQGSSIENAQNNPEWLFEWAEKVNTIFRNPWLIWGVRLITLATIVSILSIFLIDKRFFNITVILLLTQFMLFLIGLRINSKYAIIALQKDTISTFQKLLKMIETENFESKYLSELKSSLIDSNGNYASKQIKELSFIVDMMSYKDVPLISFILNVFFLVDYHCTIPLEKWKEKSGFNLRKWLNVIGKFEEISSLAIIRYDNPSWCSPQFADAKQNIFAQDMGHPLLSSDARVCNDLAIKGSGHVLLITGSNMSGKSTLLRTVGVNSVLAYTGAPVCASVFKCSIMDIHTSMRVSDNLEKNISSFYAELLRIKTIIQAVNNSKTVLFLLDEIFKGTNSKDRHIGAAVVIKKLSEMGAVGLVSTHDLELSELETDKTVNIENYHFSESYLNNQIIFDFKLRPGVSETTNAIYLMKMLGIDEL